jgi:hypothetical protein
MRLPFYIGYDLFLTQSNRGHEESWRPDYPLLPVNFPQPRKLFPQFTCRVLLHLPNHCANPILRWNHNHHMNMTNQDIQLNDLTSRQTSHDFREKFSQVASRSRIQDTAAIFWDPYNVILCLINSMPRYSRFHALNIPYRRLHIHPRAQPVELCPSGY